MLFGSPLPHLPNSLQDTVHLALSPNRHTIQAGTFSPSPFHTLFHSPPGANLDDSPYHSLTHPTVRHSPVSAAAQHTAVQASRQAAVGQAQGQRGEQQSLSRPTDALERTSTAMLIPMSAPASMKAKVKASFCCFCHGPFAVSVYVLCVHAASASCLQTEAPRRMHLTPLCLCRLHQQTAIT